MPTDASHMIGQSTELARHELARAIEEWAPSSGRFATAWPGLEIVRKEHPHTRSPLFQVPSLYIVAQGQKRVYLGGDVYDFDPLRYLMVTLPLPVESEVIAASPGEPYLALRLDLEIEIVNELALETGDDTRRRENQETQRGIYVSAVSEGLYGAVLRLVKAIEHPTERRVLAPLAEREILYHLLMGEQGQRLRAVAVADGQSYRIAEILRFLEKHYAQPLDIATIAEVSHIRPSTLHHAFKSVTNSTPLQYLKKLRLHHARAFMLHQGLGVGEAAYRVGYRSDTQFSREYRRLYGQPPSLDIAVLRTRTQEV